MNTIRWERDSGVSWLALNRPKIRNAINYEMMDELDQVLDQIESSSDKFVVITGSGERAFCSGGDLSLFHSLYTEEEAYRMLSKMGKVLRKLFLFPKPTLALLNGVAVGGGCELATSCDFRVAKKGIAFGFVQGTLEITTGWGGATMLYERMPPHLAHDYLMTANMISAEKGYQDGFVHHLIEEEDLREGCLEFLQPYLKLSDSVLAAYKNVWLSRFDRKHLEERFEMEIRQCAKLWESEAHHEAVQRFLQR